MPACSFNEPVLRKGDRGNDVRLLQTCLHGYSQLFGKGFVHDPGTVDGDFGPMTEDSLKSFQTNIAPGPVDGIAGPITWSQLDQADGTFPFGGDLHKGASGNPVRHLQRLLFAVGSDPGRVDGIYGDRTAAAVRDFQQKEGVSLTGNADGETRTLLSFVMG
jgi:peptidoglycan hydrolase-like protein with peptidoglycan-binding domain